MPASYTIDVPARLVLSRAWGALTDVDLLGHREALAHDPAFEPEFSQLFDFTEVTDLRVTAPRIREMAPGAPFALTARRAMVVSSDAAFGLARMHGLALGASDEHYRIFRDRGEAVAWLQASERVLPERESA